MADMTHKHHKLIEDAVIESVQEFVKVQQAAHTQITRTEVSRLINIFGKNFGKKLQYTNDKYDYDAWMQKLRIRASEIRTS